MRGFYKTLLLWFPGNRPLHCDSSGDSEVHFHCCSHFSGVSSFLETHCWVINREERWGLCVGTYSVNVWQAGSQEATCGPAVGPSEAVRAVCPGTGPGPAPEAPLSPLLERWQHGLSLAMTRMSWCGFCFFRHNIFCIWWWAAWRDGFSLLGTVSRGHIEGTWVFDTWFDQEALLPLVILTCLAMPSSVYFLRGHSRCACRARLWPRSRPAPNLRGYPVP